MASYLQRLRQRPQRRLRGLCLSRCHSLLYQLFLRARRVLRLVRGLMNGPLIGVGVTLPNPRLILKFGKEEHLRNLQAGRFHLRSLQWFRTQEASSHQRDANEGADLWLNPAKSELIINGHRFTSEGGTLNASLFFDLRQPHVFCASVVHARPIRDDRRVFDNRLTSFGESILVIHDLSAFRERLQKALENLKAQSVIDAYQAGDVAYFDERTYDGNVGPFRKSARFEWQGEWRLAVRTGSPAEIFEFHTDSLADISSLGRTKDLINRVEPKLDGSGYVIQIS